MLGIQLGIITLPFLSIIEVFYGSNFTNFLF